MEKESLEEIKEGITPDETTEVPKIEVEPKKKRKTRTKKKDDIPVELPPVEIPDNIIDLLVRSPFEITAKLTGDDKWILEENEVETLNPLYRQLVEKWSPSIAGRYSLEIITLSVVTAFISQRYFAVPSDEAIVAERIVADAISIKEAVSIKEAKDN